MSHICMYLLTRLIFYLVQMFFVFNLLNFRYFNEKLTREKRIKEPNSGDMAQEKKNCCPRSWFFQFRYAMPNKVFFKCFTLWYLFLLKWGLFVNNSSISTQQFNNHTSRVYTVSFTSSMVKHRKSSFFFIKHKLKLNLLYTNIAVKNLSAVSRHPSGPQISVFRDKCKKDVLFFLLETVTLVKHIYITKWIKTRNTYFLCLFTNFFLERHFWCVVLKH